MELTNEFTVDVPVDQAWDILTDLPRIAPCMPGAQLREVVGDEHHGVVKVKVGPITAEYRGTATFVERDRQAHRAVLRAEGRETRGQGNASATITAVLQPVDRATKVAVTTDLTITGRVAQFGRGVLADVSNKLLGQFVERLEQMVLSGGRDAPAEQPGGTAGRTAGGAGKPGGKTAEPGGKTAEPGGKTAEPGGKTAEPGGKAGQRPTEAASAVGQAATEPAGSAAPTPESVPAAGGGPRADGAGATSTIPAAEPAAEDSSIDMLKLVGPALAKRLVPLVAVAAAVAAVVVLRRRRRC